MVTTLRNFPSLARSWGHRLSHIAQTQLPLGRGTPHSATRLPGLTGIDRTGVVDNHGVAVHWYESGETDSVTVVFVHGFTLAAESFYRQVDYLRPRWPNARLLLIDVRGHGQTGRVRPEQCTIDGAADDVLAVLQDRGISGPVILVGHSLGGLVVLNLVRRCAEELRDRISGLVLVSTSIEALSDQGLPQLLASPVADKVYRAVEASPAEAAKFKREAAHFFAPGLAVTVFRRPTDYEIVEFHAAMIRQTPLETFVGFFDELQNHDELTAGSYLESIPGYVIAGEKDEVTPLEQAQRLIEVWPRAWLQISMDAGHMLPLEAPEIVNAAIDRLLQIVCSPEPLDTSQSD
ncbi:alpha/beta fold hydrolase [Corynebacterium alimapuense]|uniref:Alpha/beta hydrolase n=1 Tax=Corynebacterium alimapuense TaxID=1576874 RepID=A0A3M8K8K2_9CORY|nr:alpha/beta hydrolase [Corynebacterium alimapuense]RNE49563.1 alpha/beta hydrolase [Corynebacterium alimapuense]